MNYQENINKLKKASDFNFMNLRKIVDNFLPLESYFLESNNSESHTSNTLEKSKCYVPNEPNFQLPNTFLKTTVNTACKKYMQTHEEKKDYSRNIDYIIEELETFFVDYENDLEEDTEIISEDVLNNLYKSRYGL